PHGAGVFNTLLKHLRMSVDFETGEGLRRNSSSSVSSGRSKESEERIVQNAIIQTIGFFGGNLPDYQRAEVMMFIMGKASGNQEDPDDAAHSLINGDLSFKSKSMAAALSPPFLDPLFSISLMEDGELRQLVLEILHNVIDRHDNRAKLRGIRIIPNVAALKIKREKISKQDVAFMKKHGQQLYRHIFLGCKEEDNGHKNSSCSSPRSLSSPSNWPTRRWWSTSSASPSLCSLPESLDKDDRLLYFQTVDMSECLAGPGYSAERLSIPYVPQVTDKDRMTRRKSYVDTISLQVDIISNILPDKSQLAEEITFETLKKAIDTTGVEEQEREKRRQLMEKFQKAPFEEIAAHCESKANLLHDRLAQIFELTIRPPPSPSGVVSISSGHNQSVPVYEMKFPDLCVY
ncbi:hypothetical protein KUCAC02_026621, partial [Chaenocephalus aceratus]